METSKKGLDFIKTFEGFSATAYKCQAGIWTIGWGTIAYPNGKKVSKGDICTKEQADLWIAHEVNEKSAALKQLLGTYNLEVTQNEYDALVSIIYNCGSGIIRPGRSLGDALMAKNKQKIADSFLLYCKVTQLGVKVTSKGLLRRREAERKLFLGLV